MRNFLSLLLYNGVITVRDVGNYLETKFFIGSGDSTILHSSFIFRIHAGLLCHLNGFIQGQLQLQKRQGYMSKDSSSKRKDSIKVYKGVRLET